MAEPYIQEITLDINSNNSYTTIGAKQGDQGSRVILVRITQDGNEPTFTSAYSAFFRCRKPDGHAIINEATIIPNTNKIEVTLTAQTLSAAGRAYADLALYKDGNVLSTLPFIIIIMASPYVASQAISSDEFGYLQEVVSDANGIIDQAELWAVGTKGNVTQTAEYYEVEGLTQTIFNLQKDNLYIKNNEIYVPVDSEAEYDSSQTYYAFSPGDKNNAKYYVSKAIQEVRKLTRLEVEAITLDAGSSASVTASDSLGHWKFDFELPRGVAGPVGPMGPNTVWVGDTRPSIESGYTVWVNDDPDALTTVFGANDISYFNDTTYNNNTVGWGVHKALVDAENAVNDATAASSKVGVLDAEITNINSTISNLDGSVQSLDSSISSLQGIVNSKITCPSLPTQISFLTGYQEDGSANPSFGWTNELSYSNLSDKPSIGEKELNGNLSLSDLGIMSNEPIEYDDLAQSLKSKIDNNILYIYLNDVQVQPINQVVSLNNIATTSNIIHKNYLDNAWFTINQRGLTQFSQAVTEASNGYYICDRWKVLANKTLTGNDNQRTITVSSGSVLISGGSQAYFELGQIINNDIRAQLKNQYITCSINCDLGNFSNKNYSCTFKNTDTANYKPLESGYGWFMGLNISDDKMIFSIIFDPQPPDSEQTNLQDAQLKIKSVKLELGSINTLVNDTKPNYNEELLKCQQYLIYCGGKSHDDPNNIDTILCIGKAASATEVSCCFKTLAPMAATPKLESSVALNMYPYLSSGGTIRTIPSASVSSAGIINSYSDLYFSCAGGASYTKDFQYFVVLPSTATPASESDPELISYFAISAEP